jgi:hypothetical protein
MDLKYFDKQENAMQFLLILLAYSNFNKVEANSSMDGMLVTVLKRPHEFQLRMWKYLGALCG